ncbi:MAG: DUF418 domain-containing protein [Thermoleophilia bacterium]|nr:DUF418 domain-containing protein [Thermoleophilia bacterium]
MKTGEREYTVDRLRGYALLGIILVNAPFLLTSINGFTDMSAPSLGDRIAWFSVAAFFQAKSYVIFSFLFGYSLAIFLRGVERRGEPATRLYLRRLGGLFLFGAAHAILFFSGDILVLYALVGLVMIPLRKRGDRTILIVAAGLFVMQIVILGLIAAGTSSIEADATTRAIDEAFADGSFLEATLTRLIVWPFALGFITLLQEFLVASLFCVGLVCGRHRLLENPARHAAAWKRVCVIGFAIGLPIQIVAGYLLVWHDGTGLAQAGLFLNYIFAPILSAGILAAIVLLPRRGLTRAVEADGRMSLTIYLAESILLTTLSNGFGFGFYGLNALAATAVAVVVWVVLLGAAHVWLHRYTTGPAESILRAITFRRRPSLPRLAPREVAACDPIA